MFHRFVGSSRRFLPLFASIAIALSVTGCGTVPVWQRDVAELNKLGKGLTVEQVDKIFGRSSILASKTVEVGGKTYLLRHYELAEDTGRVSSHMACQKGGGCMTTFTPITIQLPFAVVFVGVQPRLLAWGKLSELDTSPDPEVVAVLPALSSSYGDYLREHSRRLF